MSELHIEDAPSPNFEAREGEADILLLHYTGMADGASALALLRDPEPKAGRYAGLAPGIDTSDPERAMGRVSAHYLVEADGRVFRLVPESETAWHAGQGSWAGGQGVNARSIGVEIVNGGHDFGLPDFPPAQIEALTALCRAILTRHPIPPWRVLAHSDIAPGRKADPGEKFPWSALARAGVGLAPPGAGAGPAKLRKGDAGPEVERLQRRLGAWGYGLVESGGFDDRTREVVAAFQSHWRVPGEGEAAGVWTEADEAMLAALFAAARTAARKDAPNRAWGEPPLEPVR